ncbi:hypothetical protein BKA67DRAFT_580803 [Truncatella angustata]|uniref:Uncharacterized protein n=1 Tax=Truncatella angustata TaxID=152316 RepID=A0A9P8UD73_9PEZI|nr:uncharacterized protein BKA67DRAFT_580803 [Truncatella angustata]KAH6646882.1 hypothetical protein BKA67DRAFT_580803 [Truncatella angustata]KAH8197686.1 hypothetical protein TruAng_008145 [Truncatella angustata]
MAPTQPENPSRLAGNEQRQQSPQSPMEEISLQPMAPQPMNPEAPHPESQEMGLRGGDRGGMCPGRFCFCVPCPIPCDFCII